MMKEMKNYLDFNDILDFFFNSWVFGYKHLWYLVDKDKSKINFNF